MYFFFFQAEDGIRDVAVTGVQTCALPISFVVDFFSHIDRVREFCKARKIEWREAAGPRVVIPSPSAQELRQLFERFEGENFWIRAGSATATADNAVAGDRFLRGLEALQPGYTCPTVF